MRTALIIKASRVVESCQTIEQLLIAEKYIELALRASTSEAYKEIIKSAEEYFDLRTQLYRSITQKKINFYVF